MPKMALAEALSESRIDYAHIAALGGLRGRKRDVPADVNAFCQNQRFHRSWYASARTPGLFGCT
jgi:hypothetical protein